MRRVIIRCVVASVLLIGVGSESNLAGAASKTQQVNITSHMSFNDPPPNTGDFTTSGPATDSGLICEVGRVVDTGLVFGGFESGHQVQILVRKDFTCADGSGTIHIKIQVHANFDGTEKFTWVVQGGTGDYSNLHGSGQGFTVPNAASQPPGNTNFYEGFVVG